MSLARVELDVLDQFLLRLAGEGVWTVKARVSACEGIGVHLSPPDREMVRSRLFLIERFEHLLARPADYVRSEGAEQAARTPPAQR